MRVGEAGEKSVTAREGDQEAVEPLAVGERGAVLVGLGVFREHVIVGRPAGEQRREDLTFAREG